MPPRPCHISNLCISFQQFYRGTTILRRCRYELPILGSSFSGCTHQQLGLRNRRTGKAAAKPRRLREIVGKGEDSIGSTSGDGFYYMGRMAWWRDMLLDAVGYRIQDRVYLCKDIHSKVDEQWPRERILQYLMDLYRLNDSKFRLRVFWFILVMIRGHLYKNPPGYWHLGLEIDLIAAQIHLGKTNYCDRLFENDEFRPSLCAQEAIANIAARGKDWGAMIYHARQLIDSGQSDKAIVTATEICRATRCGPPGVSQTKSGRSLPSPWETLYGAFEATESEDLPLAYRYGAVVWDHPIACEKYALSTLVRPGTKHWLVYATKAAMAGEAKLMQHLGMYYLALHGWYPRKSHTSNKYDSQTGFAWLEMATMFLEPELAARIWGGLALLLREHGDRAGGMKYLHEGIKQIEGKLELTPEDDDSGKAVDILNVLVQNWKHEEMVTTREEKVTSARYLGPPIIPVVE